MRLAALSAFALALASAAAADPAATIMGVTRDAGTGCVTIRYSLGGADAIVTVGGDVASADGSWTPLDAAAFRRVTGDVNARVSVGADRTIVWMPEGDGLLAAANGLRLRLTLWSPAQPPDYMAQEIGGGEDPRYYTSEAALPHAVTDSYWKAARILFRKIPAKGVVWNMASVSPRRFVRLNADYYLSVYPYTKAQTQSVGGYDASIPEAVDPDAKAGACPQFRVAYHYYRGLCPDDRTASYPIAEGSNLAALNAQLAVPVDFPTEAEWEYACRAGQGTALYSGEEATEENAAKLAWYGGNAGGRRVHETGLKAPNAWGLYDMLGNVWEWCLDYYAESDNAYFADGTVDDPKGPSSAQVYNGRSPARVVRGLCFWSGGKELVQGANYRWGYDYTHGEDPAFGARLRAPIPGADADVIAHGTATWTSLDNSVRTDYWDCTGYENPRVIEVVYEPSGMDFRPGTCAASDDVRAADGFFDSEVWSDCRSDGIGLNTRPVSGGVVIFR